MKILYLNEMPDYIPFYVQCSNGLGEKTDPTSAQLTIYSEAGNGVAFSTKQITGSPFTPQKINNRIGLWGVMIPKSSFSNGNFYLAIWEMTIDGTNSVKAEKYFAGTENGQNPKITFSYKLTDEKSGSVIPQASVEISTDLSGNNVIFRGETDNNGKLKFEIDTEELSDKLYFWRKKRNFKFTDPEVQNLFELTGSGKNNTTGSGNKTRKTFINHPNR